MNENEDFRGMTALVTGASKGIGAETALVLAARGVFTFIHYNTGRQEACQVLERVRAEGGDGEVLQSDLNSSEGVHHPIHALDNDGRPIDIFINNAGSLIKRTPFLELTEDLWTRVFMLNLTSAFMITHACLRGMVETKRGIVVNISSVAARLGGARCYCLFLSKGSALDHDKRLSTRVCTSRHPS